MTPLELYAVLLAAERSRAEKKRPVSDEYCALLDQCIEDLKAGKPLSPWSRERMQILVEVERLRMGKTKNECLSVKRSEITLADRDGRIDDLHAAARFLGVEGKYVEAGPGLWRF